MSNPIVYPTRALDVIPSDDVNIPYPNMVLTGTADATGSFFLIDSTTDFIAQGIKVGDTILNESTGKWVKVTSVPSVGGRLGISSNDFGSGDNYLIYQGENAGCLLYVGDTGDLEILTAGNNQILIQSVTGGTLIPIRVLRVLASNTTCSDIIALW
jgi:hypothetical protein